MPPTVTSTTPTASATGVAVAANITAQFSEAATGVSGASFTLTPQAGGGTILSHHHYGVAPKTATLNPTASGLPVGATISSVKLRLFVINDSTGSGVFKQITSINWAESTPGTPCPQLMGRNWRRSGRSLRCQQPASASSRR
jgi:hypothetical protein